jgi:hypothetical protein
VRPTLCAFNYVGVGRVGIDCLVQSGREQEGEGETKELRSCVITLEAGRNFVESERIEGKRIPGSHSRGENLEVSENGGSSSKQRTSGGRDATMFSVGFALLRPDHQQCSSRGGAGEEGVLGRRSVSELIRKQCKRRLPSRKREEHPQYTRETELVDGHHCCSCP